MRIALVSPYSWSYPGGVTRHIEALAECFLAEGHQVGVLAPVDPPDSVSTLLHRGARPRSRPLPAYLVPLGRTVAFKANGAVSNLSITPRAVAAMHHELRTGGYDVVHVHEPVAPVLGWAATDWTPLARVATFHTYNEHWFSHQLAAALGARRMLNRLHVRIAVSEPAAWTARRFFGGHYRVIPNGVHFDARRALLAASRPPGDRLRIVFVGQPVARKGLPFLLRAFEALRQHVPAELTLIGPSPGDVSSVAVGDRVHALGNVDDERKRIELERADVLCAPSLGGESFGMVLTEAFAAGTPVIASDIAGYRDVVHNGVDGILVPPGDAQAIAEALYDLSNAPARRAEMARAAAGEVARFAWPGVAARVLEAYQDAIATPAPSGSIRRAAVRVGALPADLRPRVPARRLPTLEPSHPTPRRDRGTRIRRAVLLVATIAVAALAVLAVRKMGFHHVTSALLRTDLTLVVVGLVVMSASMVLRALSWHAVLRAGLPDAPIRLPDTMRALFIGVLVSSTLPASLGEPSRAFVIVRRSGRGWEILPVVVGTLMSQTLLNVAALTILGGITFASVDLFAGHQAVLVAGAAGIALAVALVVAAPALLRRASGSRWLHHVYTLATQLRAGLTVFRRPRLGTIAVSAQFLAWGMQCASVYLLLDALHLTDRTGVLGAVAVLFAVNVTMLLPVTPGDVGVFQAAAAAVLHAGWQVPYSTGVAFGVVLQAVELAAALLMGLPALFLEGLSWRQITQRPPGAAEIHLPPPAQPTPSRHPEGQEGGTVDPAPTTPVGDRRPT
jgi:phosphatidyl-myo-inositol alpha-mannosyltransferase